MTCTSHRVLALGAILVFAVSLGARCGKPPKLVVEAPADGFFTDERGVLVSGFVQNVGPESAALTINGIPTPIQADGRFSFVLSLDPLLLLNPVLVELTVASNGRVVRERRTVVNGPSVAEGEFSPDGLGLWLGDTGIDQLEAQIGSDVLGSLDLASSVTGRTFDLGCVIDTPLGCIQDADVTIESFTHGAVVLDDIDARNDFTNLTVTLFNLFATYDTDGVDCQGELEADSLTFSANFDQQPQAGQPSLLDVTQVSAEATFNSFDNDFTGGTCDVFGGLIGDIVGDVEDEVRDALEGLDISSAIADALSGLNPAGPLGDALGFVLEANFGTIAEDGVGIRYGLDTRITVPEPDPDAPDMTASYQRLDPLPFYGSTTPMGTPFDVGVSISTAAFNQAIRAGIEDGFLRFEITELDLGGGPIPLTAGLLALFVPEFSVVDPDEPVAIVVQPSLAPVVCGLPGPGGELAELRMAGLEADVLVGQSSLLRFVIDTALGVDLELDVAGGALTPQFGAPPAEDIGVTIVANPIDTNEASLRALLPEVLSLALPDLLSSLGSLELPEFQGLELIPVEVGREGRVVTIYTTLAPPL